MSPPHLTSLCFIPHGYRGFLTSKTTTSQKKVIGHCLHRTTGWRGPLEAIWSNHPHSSRATLSQWPRTMSRQLLNISEEGDHNLSEQCVPVLEYPHRRGYPSTLSSFHGQFEQALIGQRTWPAPRPWAVRGAQQALSRCINETASHDGRVGLRGMCIPDGLQPWATCGPPSWQHCSSRDTPVEDHHP